MSQIHFYPPPPLSPSTSLSPSLSLSLSPSLSHSLYLKFFSYLVDDDLKRVGCGIKGNILVRGPPCFGGKASSSSSPLDLLFLLQFILRICDFFALISSFSLSIFFLSIFLSFYSFLIYLSFFHSLFLTFYLSFFHSLFLTFYLSYFLSFFLASSTLHRLRE